jgi:ribosomal protein S14
MIAANVPIYVALDPVDMRKSFDALALCVRELGHDPQCGALYVFAGKSRESTAFCIRNGLVDDRLPMASAVRKARNRDASDAFRGTRVCTPCDRRSGIARTSELDVGRGCVRQHDARSASPERRGADGARRSVEDGTGCIRSCGSSQIRG